MDMHISSNVTQVINSTQGSEDMKIKMERIDSEASTSHCETKQESFDVKSYIPVSGRLHQMVYHTVFLIARTSRPLNDLRNLITLRYELLAQCTGTPRGVPPRQDSHRRAFRLLVFLFRVFVY